MTRLRICVNNCANCWKTFVNIPFPWHALRIEMRLIEFIRPKKGSTQVFTVHKIAGFPTFSDIFLPLNSISNVKYFSRLAAIDKFV